ncbi:MAG: VOC family protein [Bacteroidia bacterium]|nr:VOC family protein [Bacteroidia bacterium]
MTNAINWFEIPVLDFERAKKFYSEVLGQEVVDHPMPEFKYGILPYDQEAKGVGGAIIEAKDMQKPSADGTTIYLNGGDDLSAPLSRVEAAGGKVIMPKTSIGENGFMAQFIDTEGNKLALHSMS